MIEEQAEENWKQRIRAVAVIMKRGLPQFLGFTLLFQILGAVVFGPLTGWMTAQLIAWSGSGAISNYDLASFFLSPKGLIYLTVVTTMAFTLLFFEFGGLIAMAVAFLKGKPIRLPQLFLFLVASFPRLWRLSVRQFIVLFGYAVPCLAVAGGAYLLFLTKNDINYYLLVKPPAFWYAATLAGMAGLVFAILAFRLMIDWIYSVPLLLVAGSSPATALKESKCLVAGRRPEMLGMLLRWLAWLVLLLSALWLFMAVLKFVLLGIAGQRVGLVLAMTAVIGVAHFLASTLVGMLAIAALSCGVARRFLELRPEARLPDSLSGTELALLRKVKALLPVGWAIVLILGSLTTYSAVRLVGQVELRDTVGITAHRGSSITAPENTMAAILLAVEEGADFVEIDVQETRDGTIVLVHDKDLKRVFDIDKGVWEVSYDELKDLDSGGWFSPAFSDQRIATLTQVIKAVQGRAQLNIELKFNGHEQQLATEVVRIVNDHGFRNQCILTTLDYNGLQRIRAADPQMRTGVIVTTAIGDITKLQTNLLSVSAGAVTRDLISRAHQRELEVHVWTVNEVSLMNTMIGMGVDNIITDDPKLLGEVLRERATLSSAEKILLQLADITSRGF